MRALLFLGAALSVAGCESMDRDQLTRVSVTGPGSLSIHAKLDPIYGHETHKRWVREIMAESGYCPDGFDVVSERVFKRRAMLGADISEVTFGIRCREDKTPDR